jgi:hypothetical protein
MHLVSKERCHDGPGVDGQTAIASYFSPMAGPRAKKKKKKRTQLYTKKKHNKKKRYTAMLC